jgi:hypothetical protein
LTKLILTVLEELVGKLTRSIGPIVELLMHWPSTVKVLFCNKSICEPVVMYNITLGISHGDSVLILRKIHELREFIKTDTA